MGYTKGIRWTKEMVHKEALKYKTRKEFQLNSSPACNYAKKKKWIIEVCSHMVNLTGKRSIRTIEDCKEVALRYDVMVDFMKKENAVYLYSQRRGWLNHMTSHMTKKTRWKDKKEEVHQVALKYQNRGEFCLKDETYYEVARRWGWLDDICGHMVSVGHKFMRLVYVYEFDDKTVYVGLTGNDLKRSNSHSTSNDSPVYRHQQETGLNPIKKIITDGYIYSEDAKVIEDETIQKYKTEGWNLLNKAKAGGLGGSDRIWTDEKIRETISKYTYESELRKNEPKLINKLQSVKKLDEYLKVLIKDTPIYWNEELVKETVSKYTHLKEIKKYYPGALGWARKNNKEYLIEGLIDGNKEKSVTKRFDNLDEILEVASKTKNISEFINNHGGMYNSAKQNGWLDEIKKVIPPKFLWTKDKAMEITKKYVDYQTFRVENKNVYDAIMKYGWNDCLTHLNRTFKEWTYDEVKEEALKFKCRNDFYNGSNNAYSYALRHNVLDEITTHMEKRNIKGYNQEIYICSVCGEKVGGKGNLIRWHEDNCKDRPNSNKNKR